MSVDNTTQRLQLPEWSATDGVLRTDFNNAFSLIDQWVAIAEHGTAAVSSIDPTDDGRINSFYYRTTDGTLSWSDGVSWHTVLTEDSVGNGLTFSGGDIAVNAGDGLGFTGTALKVNTGATTEISSDALIVKSGSLTQTQLSSGYRAIRVEGSAPASAGVAAGDVWTDTGTSNKEAIYVRTSGNTWQRPWNSPWGILAIVNTTNAFTGSGNADLAGVTGTVTVSADRLIRIRCTTPGIAVNAANAQLKIMESTTVLQRSIVYGSNSLVTVPLGVETVFSPNAGSHTYKIAIESTASWTIQTSAASFQSLVFTIEDLGPSV